MSMHREIVELTAKGWERSAIAQALGCSVDYVRAALARHRRPDHYAALARENNRLAYLENPKKFAERRRRWNAKNPGKMAEYQRRSRARKAEQQGAFDVSR